MSEQVNKTRRNITVFGEETEFDGFLEFKDRLVITGKFKGKIDSPSGDLEIAKNAVCEVESLKVNSIVVNGTVSGSMEALERVEICNGSKVSSDITTARLRIANNVDYSGQISMLETEPETDLFSVASGEFKQAMILKSDRVK
ncbi:MAG: polymer-forming cytoskeletal protein [Treponema sp.]|nr:polymer-forming cytoskeletal protein [Treponema sp.]